MGYLFDAVSDKKKVCTQQGKLRLQSRVQTGACIGSFAIPGEGARRLHHKWRRVTHNFSPTTGRRRLIRLDIRGAAPLGRRAGDRRASDRRESAIKPFLMPRVTATNASEIVTTCVDLVAMLEAAKAPSTSPMLEGEATLDTFPRRLRGSALAEAAPPTHMLPSFLSFNQGSSSREATAIWR
jgi:hypothetical protein